MQYFNPLKTDGTQSSSTLNALHFTHELHLCTQCNAFSIKPSFPHTPIQQQLPTWWPRTKWSLSFSKGTGNVLTRARAHTHTHTHTHTHIHTHTHTHIFRLTPFLVQIPCARILSFFYSLLNSWTCTIKGRQKDIRGEFNERDCKKPLIEPVICWRAWVVTYTRFAGFHYSKLAQRVTLLICIPGMPGSILGWDISYTDWDWSWISSMLQGKVWNVKGNLH